MGERVRRVVSVSLGSSSRDHVAEAEFLGEKFRVERIGTDGDIARAIRLIKELDGKVDAFGMGGIDLYVRAGKRRYVLRDAVPIARAAKVTPIVDGGGLKDTLERRVVRYLHENMAPFTGKTVLIPSAVDRFGMAETFAALGAKLLLGDLIFILNLPIAMTSLKQLDLVARAIAPIVCKLPFRWIYPVGEKQKRQRPRHVRYFAEASVIAGDFHFIRRYMPEQLDGKMIITNTVTADDIELLRRSGASILVTTTPELQGRSFGTNVMEGVLVCLSGKRPEDLTPRDYEELLDKIGFKPRIERLS